MTSRQTTLVLALACCASLLVVVFQSFFAQGETIIRFQSTEPDAIELWVGSRLLGIAPLQIPSHQMKRIILAEFPAADCPKNSEAGFALTPQNDGTTVFRFSFDGGPHLRFMQNKKEVPVKAEIFKGSRSNVLHLTLRVPEEP